MIPMFPITMFSTSDVPPPELPSIEWTGDFTPPGGEYTFTFDSDNDFWILDGDFPGADISATISFTFTNVQIVRVDIDTTYAFTLGSSASVLDNVDASSVRFVNGGISITDLPGNPTIDLSSLEDVEWNFIYSNNPNVTAPPILGDLVLVVGILQCGNNPLMETPPNWSTLQSCQSSIVYFDNIATTVLPDLSSLLNVTGQLTLSGCPLVTSATFPPVLQQVGNISYNGDGLDQTSVDGILVRLVGLDGTGGTTLFVSNVDLSGGTNATPSATGLAAKATLEGRGCVVTVN